ncbi:hypothetical protein OROGR_004484 [Orobanche gracilis]
MGLMMGAGLIYTPTSLIFLKVPSISKFQWHPFSLTSNASINKNTISIIIKSEGQWTSNLYAKVLADDDQDSEAGQRKCIPIALEGPYGPDSLEFLRRPPVLVASPFGVWRRLGVIVDDWVDKPMIYGHDNLLLVAGGIGITPFLSILPEITSNSSNTRNGYPHKIQLIYTTKYSQDVCLLEPILPNLLNTQQFRIKLGLYVTRENQTGTTTLRDILDGITEIRTKKFGTESAGHAAYGSERLLFTAGIIFVSSVVFLLSLVFSNRFLVVPQSKKQSDRKSSSSRTDLLLMCSFAVAVVVSAFLSVTIRCKRLKRELPFFPDEEGKGAEQRLFEDDSDLDRHEIHFGGRPDFQDILSSFSSECGGSDVGVLVCGPESMQESVAIACRQGARFNVSVAWKPLFALAFFFGVNFFRTTIENTTAAATFVFPAAATFVFSGGC